MLRSGERQVAPTLDEVRRDHIARYAWAARTLPAGSRVVDMCCGIGYGARILAEAGHKVTACDIDLDALTYGGQHYAHPNITWHRCNAADGATILQPHDAAVCFEAIEHLKDPRPMLRELRRLASILLCSVPDQDGFPWRPEYQFHHRHYTARELGALLEDCGWRAETFWRQNGPESDVERDVGEDPPPRTTIVEAVRADARIIPMAGPAPEPVAAGAVLPELIRPQPILPRPRSVAILGLGPSLEAYADIAKRLGNRRNLVDEVWGINAAGDVFQCDRVFHMDDVRIQELRAAAKPDSNIAAMLGWLRRHPGPIYTSRPHPDYPGLVPYPLQDVMNTCQAGPYFNSTAAYAVALAVHIGVEELHLYGCDFTFPNAHQAEQGRACVEFYLGLGRARGMTIALPAGTSLMDGTAAGMVQPYGYDTLEVTIQESDDGQVSLGFAPRASLPTAEEIERRYDHGRHPNPLLRN